MAHGSTNDPTAGIVVIGDEVLSASVSDINSQFLCQRLTQLGVALQRVVVVPDRVDEIARDVADCAARYTHVITTGGVGPTHDDVTMEGIAAAFNMPMRRHPEAERLIRSFYGHDMAPAALSMANVPEAAELILTPSMRFPVVRVNNVWIFPGSPHLLQMKFEMVADHFAAAPFHSAKLALDTGEPEIADFLRQVQQDHPQVALGSYPQEPGQPVRLILTLKSKDLSCVTQAKQTLEAGLAQHLVALP